MKQSSTGNTDPAYMLSSWLSYWMVYFRLPKSYCILKRNICAELCGSLYLIAQSRLNFNYSFTILFFVLNIRGGLAEVLCKPKILPLKSAVLVQLQKIEKEIEVREEGEEPDNFNVRDHKWWNCINIDRFCYSYCRHEGIIRLLEALSPAIWINWTPGRLVTDDVSFNIIIFSLIFGCTMPPLVTGNRTVVMPISYAEQRSLQHTNLIGLFWNQVNEDVVVKIE
jgi:Cilia BBSome complex subunit 10